MAKDIQSKKRKASVPEEAAEQMKKPKKSTSEGPKEKKRKSVEDSAVISSKKSKKSKTAAADDVAANPAPKNTESATTKAKKEKKSGTKFKNTEELEPEEIDLPTDEVEEAEASEDDESEVDDQTVALLKGFESDDDEEDAENEGGLQEGRPVPKVPTITGKNKKVIKQAAESEKPGVVYVGHIPHGFYEHEMRQYFEQFGPILQLRLSRNRKTGASKHYAFVQFASDVVADIVAKTMDNYLLFNHILKVKLISEEQVPENLFKGANKRFKKVPWNKIAGRKLAQGASEAAWEKRIEKEEARRIEKARKMKALGYEFEAPKIKSAKNVAKKPVAIENGDEVKAIEAPVVEESRRTREMKEKKPKAAEPAVEAPEKKLKRTKSKADIAEATNGSEEVAEEKTKKQKKTRRAKAEA